MSHLPDYLGLLTASSLAATVLPFQSEVLLFGMLGRALPVARVGAGGEFRQHLGVFRELGSRVVSGALRGPALVSGEAGEDGAERKNGTTDTLGGVAVRDCTIRREIDCPSPHL
jgi:hypothetical protein